MDMDPLGQALFGLQTDDDDFDEMSMITDIPLNSAPSFPSSFSPAAAGNIPQRSTVSALAQQWEKENDLAKLMGKPQRQTKPTTAGPTLRSTVSAPTLRGDTEMEVDKNLALDALPGSLTAIKMDLLGQGSDRARGMTRSISSGNSGDQLADARRSRATLPPNFRLTFDPSHAPSVGAVGAGPVLPVPAAQALAGAVMANAGAGANRSAAANFSVLSAKEAIAEEEEEMAMNMSLHGNPFGPRPSDPNSFAWLAGHDDPNGGMGAAGGGRGGSRMNNMSSSIGTALR